MITKEQRQGPNGLSFGECFRFNMGGNKLARIQLNTQRLYKDSQAKKILKLTCQRALFEGNTGAFFF